MESISLPSQQCVLLGAGGHASVLLDALRAASLPMPQLVLDADSNKWGTDWLGLSVLGGDELLDDLAQQRKVLHFLNGIGSTGSTQVRKRIFEKGLASGLKPLNILHPHAIISPGAILKSGVQILAGAIVAYNAHIGHNVIVNHGTIIDHDVDIGDHGHIAPGARLSGGVKLGVGVHVGTGAIIKQGVQIGDSAVVGAGAVVLRDVDPQTTVVGVPAKVLY